MRILLVHPNFPSQLRAIASVMTNNKGNDVRFLTARAEGEIPGVRKVLYKPKRAPSDKAHRYLRLFEEAVLHGQAAFEACSKLKASGFVPDVILGHAGWGPTLYLKDVFPRATMALVFEWFYRARGSDCDFDPSEPLTPDDEARIRTKNAAILADLAACDGGIVPTRFQYEQFPPHLRGNLIVNHEGIDTNFFKPNPGAPLILSGGKLDLTGVKEIVTYATRGMEPYRGFPQFIEAAHLLQKKRPNVHVVVGGDDRVAYGKKAPEGKTYKDILLEKFPLDPARTHFVGSLPYNEYLKLLQCTSAHVYLTRPFVLSWSLLEAMSCGALVVASDTAPVREVITDGINGVLVDFFRPDLLADALDRALEEPARFEQMRRSARATVEGQYDIKSCLRHKLDWLRDLASSSR
jgi:glycosyltransferase involved in cell wall biosynthesis